MDTHAPGEKHPLRIVVLMPVRDDWSPAGELIRRIDAELASGQFSVEVLLVDDASREVVSREQFEFAYLAVRKIRVLPLRRNLGHQRAIAIGLAHVHRNLRCDAVVVMDADGEDTPAGVVELLRSYAENEGRRAVFASRIRRSESLIFRVLYHAYRALHRALTGIGVRVGNFSVLPATHLSVLVTMSELWNHYAAAVFRSKLPMSTVPIPRGNRLSGTSKMNFVSLVAHGLSAISVFADIVGVRLLIVTLSGCILAFFSLCAVVAIRFFTNWAVPGWATYAAGLLVIIMMQLITIAAAFAFFMLSNRTNLGFIPHRDYCLFAAEETVVYPANE
jgi:glycosyltransferase involved in cell wall biosynthesis